MTNRSSLGAALVAALALAAGGPAFAAEGEILITHAKALAGNITPGDAPGYPITISKTGSYKLGGNLIPGAEKNGIDITGDFVSLDMNGFTLHGRGEAKIGITGKGNGARVANGSIVNFKAYGLYATGDTWTIESMLFTGGFFKIYVTMSRVLNSTVSDNQADGIHCLNSCLVEGNIVSRNGAYGSDIASGAVLHNVIIDNGDVGLVGDLLVGYGENTIEDNNQGGEQTEGSPARLFPNACWPTPCL